MIRYAITDRKLFPSLDALIAQLKNSNATHIQLREKDLPAFELAALARAILKACPDKKLLINSRPDIAIATHAAGVHLTSAATELTPTQIRTLYAKLNLPRPLISISTHTLAEVASAKDEADLILFAPVFEKNGTPGVGLGLLTQAAAIAPSKVLALGGVTPANTPACLAAEAVGIAGIRLFL